MVQRKMTNNKL